MGKRGPKNLTFKQRKTIKILQENGGSVGSAMRQAGYSPASAKTPSKFIESKAYSQFLNEAGVTDEVLSKKQSDLLGAARIESQVFDAESKVETTTHSPSGRKLKNPIVKTIWIHIPDKQIKELIESVPGHRLMYILKGGTSKRAFFQVPENIVQSKQIEMSLKVKGHFAPEAHTVKYEMTEEERSVYESIFGKNKK